MNKEKKIIIIIKSHKVEEILNRAEKKSRQNYPKFAKGEIHYKVFLGKNF